MSASKVSGDGSEAGDAGAPVVSIITPTYNHEAYVAQMFESVRAQTFNGGEHVVVDDGSTDATWEIIRRHADRDPRIHAFRQDHLGIWQLATTYNFALSHCRGWLVAILEGDDLWPSEKLAIQAPEHLESSSAVSYGWLTCSFPTAPLGDWMGLPFGVVSIIAFSCASCCWGERPYSPLR